jgi:hypothetical protein
MYQTPHRVARGSAPIRNKDIERMFFSEGNPPIGGILRSRLRGAMVAPGLDLKQVRAAGYRRISCD